MKDIDDLARIAVHESYLLHREFGPGMLESAYESLLCVRLQRQGLSVRRQCPVSLSYEGVELAEVLRIDLLVEGQLVLELKAVERSLPVHLRQVLTYLKMLKLPVGLLINFGAPTIKEGISRVANRHAEQSEPVPEKSDSRQAAKAPRVSVVKDLADCTVGAQSAPK